MDHLKPESVVFLLGVLAALAGLQSINDTVKKHWALQALFFLGILVQIATQWVQYSNATENRKDAERKTALALFAYTENDPFLLHLFAQDPYIEGYRYFKNNDLSTAKNLFEKAIQERKSVAPSYYVLGVIGVKEGKDLTQARDHVEAAIAYDKEYPSPYYLRARIRLEAKERSGALEDLHKAVTLGVSQCYHINSAKEVETVWKEIADDKDSGKLFRDMQKQCRDQHGLAINTSSPSKL